MVRIKLIRVLGIDSMFLTKYMTRCRGQLFFPKSLVGFSE